MPESVIIEIWTIPPGHQPETIDLLRAALEAFRLIDGYIEGGVLANRDATKVAWYVRMRSADALESAVERDEIRERVLALQSIGSSHGDAFDRIWVTAPATARGPINVSYGAF